MARSFDDSPEFPPNRQRYPRDVTRLRILNQAHVSLLAQGVPEPIEVRLATVLERLGMTTGAAYNIWDSQEAFREDLTLHIAKNAKWFLSEEETTRLLEAIQSLDEHEAAEFLLTEALRLRLESPDEPVSHFLTSIREPSDELHSEMNRLDQEITQAATVLVAGWLDRFNRLPKAPYTLAQLVTLASSLVDGLALAQRFQPANVEPKAQRAKRLLGDVLLNVTEPV